MPIKTPSDFFVGSKPIALVVGGSGFVGSFVCEKLLERKVKVICLDTSSAYKKNIESLLVNENFAYLEGQITKKNLKEIVRVNYVLNLASIESSLVNENPSLEVLETSSIGTKNLLSFTQEKNAKFLLVSTIDLGNLTQPSEVVRYDERALPREIKKFAEVLVLQYGLEQKVDVRVVRLGDVYGPRMTLSKEGRLARFIRDALYNRPITENSESLFPVYITDAVEGIVKAIFSSGTKNKIIPLVGKPTTSKELVLTLGEIQGTGSIDLLGGLFQESSNLANGQSVISWKPKISLKDGLRQTLIWFAQNQQNVSIVQKNDIIARREVDAPSRFSQGVKLLNQTQKVILKTTKMMGESFWEEEKKQRQEKVHNSKKNAYKIFVVFICAIVLFWLFAFPYVTSFIGIGELYLAKQNLGRSDTKNAHYWSKQSEFWFNLGESGFDRWRQIPMLGVKGKQISQEIKVLKETSRTAASASLVLTQMKSMFEGITGEEAYDVSIYIESLPIELKNLQQQLAFLEAEINKQDGTSGILSVSKVLKKINLTGFRKAASGMSEIIAFLPALLGENSKKTYLILLQNNNELRPTGGFIGSYGFLTFEKGRMINFEIQDVYSADGQLKGHVEPPLPIRQYLGEGNWYLRDSNWSPDFPTSAQRAVWFIDKELGQKVNGVIVVDLEFVKKLLSYTGPIKLDDFGETVTSANVYEKTQAQAENSFFPGSSNKKDFLTALFRKLETTFLEDKTSSVGMLIQATISSLEERHLSIWTDSPQANAALNRIGWDGAIVNTSCNQQDCSNDYLQVVDANLGVNKSNYYLERTYRLEASIDEKNILHRLTIYYKNNSLPGVWPGGDYKNYLRVYTNPKSKLSSFFTDNGISQQPVIIEQTTEKGKSVFGGLVNVPAGESLEVIVNWSSPLEAKAQKLALLWQKQAGTLFDPIAITINIPSSSEVYSFPKPLLTTDTKVEYNTTLGHDFMATTVWQVK